MQNKVIFWEDGLTFFFLAERWPYPDVVYNSTTMLWACCFNPIENILDCTKPGNETFQGPPPSASASVTLTLNTPSTMATLQSTTTKRPTGSSASLKPTSSSIPDDRSSSTQSQSCKNSSQRGVDIGLGVTVGVLGSAIVAGVIAYASQNWRESRRENSRENRRENWGDDGPWRLDGPDGRDGPDGGNPLRGGKDPWEGWELRRANSTRRGGDAGGGDDRWGGNGPNKGGDPSGGMFPPRGYNHEGHNGPRGGKAPKEGKSPWKGHIRSQSSDTDEDFPPKDQPTITQNRNIETGSYRTKRKVEKIISHELKPDDSETGRKKHSSRGRSSRSTRRVVIKGIPKRPTKQKRQILVVTGLTESLGGSKLASKEGSRRGRPEVTKSPYQGPGRRSSSSSSSPNRERVRPVVPRDPNSGLGGNRISSSSSSPSTRRDRRRSRLKQSIVLRSPRPRVEEIPVVQLRPQRQSTMSRSLSPRVRRQYGDSERSEYHVEREVVAHDNVLSRETARTRTLAYQTG